MTTTSSYSSWRFSIRAILRCSLWPKRCLSTLTWTSITPFTTRRPNIAWSTPKPRYSTSSTRTSQTILQTTKWSRAFSSIGCLSRPNWASTIYLNQDSSPIRTLKSWTRTSPRLSLRMINRRLSSDLKRSLIQWSKMILLPLLHTRRKFYLWDKQKVQRRVDLTTLLFNLFAWSRIHLRVIKLVFLRVWYSIPSKRTSKPFSTTIRSSFGEALTSSKTRRGRSLHITKIACSSPSQSRESKFRSSSLPSTPKKRKWLYTQSQE